MEARLALRLALDFTPAPPTHSLSPGLILSLLPQRPTSIPLTPGSLPLGKGETNSTNGLNPVRTHTGTRTHVPGLEPSQNPQWDLNPQF